MLSGGLRTKGITRQSQENEPLITVVTVVRNGDKTLEDTMLSVINQTYVNIEYIIVDGASTDDTLDIIKKYEDKIDYWMSEPDKGIYDAMNKGIDLATGEWILMVNSDDHLIDYVILNKVSKILNSTNANIVHGNIIVVYSNDRKRRVLPEREDMLPRKMCLNHGTCFIRNIVYKIRKYNYQYKIAADYDFLLWCYINKYSFEYVDLDIIYFSANGTTGRPNFGNMDAYKIWCFYYSKPKAFVYFLRDTLPKLVKVPIKIILSKIGLY